MIDLQTEVTIAVQRFRRITHISIADLADEMGTERSKLSRRLAGKRKWQWDDLEALHNLGIIRINTDLEYGYES